MLGEVLRFVQLEPTGQMARRVRLRLGLYGSKWVYFLDYDLPFHPISNSGAVGFAFNESSHASINHPI